MRRQHNQPRVLDGGEGHQHKICRVVGEGLLALGAHVVTVGQRCLVTVVAVGDIELAWREEGRDRLGQRGIVEAPEAVALACVVGEVGVVNAGGRLVQDRAQLLVGIVVERYERAEVGGAGLHELEPVVLGLAHRALMRQDYPRVPRLQAHARQQSHPSPLGVRDAKGLLIDVERGRILAHYVLQPPLGEERRRARVLVVQAIVAWLVAPKLQPDDVVGITRVVALLRLSRDHIVGRSDQRGEVLRRSVANAG